MVLLQYLYFYQSRNILFSLFTWDVFEIFIFSFFRPTAIIFGLIVVAVLLAGFVYSTRQNIALINLAQDRPIVILLLLLIAAFIVIRMFGTVFAFLFGIALPLACKSYQTILILLNYFIMKFSNCCSCNSSYTNSTK